MDFKKDIAKLYENIISEDIVEESVPRFALNDYTQLIDEGSHGETKAVTELIKQGLKEGLIKDAKVTNSGWILYSAVDGSKFTSHRGENNFHYMRRYLDGLRKVKKVA